jgi:hypothetical protein
MFLLQFLFGLVFLFSFFAGDFLDFLLGDDLSLGFLLLDPK